MRVLKRDKETTKENGAANTEPRSVGDTQLSKEGKSARAKARWAELAKGTREYYPEHLNSTDYTKLLDSWIFTQQVDCRG